MLKTKGFGYIFVTQTFLKAFTTAKHVFVSELLFTNNLQGSLANAVANRTKA